MLFIFYSLYWIILEPKKNLYIYIYIYIISYICIYITFSETQVYCLGAKILYKPALSFTRSLTAKSLWGLTIFLFWPITRQKIFVWNNICLWFCDIFFNFTVFTSKVVILYYNLLCFNAEFLIFFCLVICLSVFLLSIPIFLNYIAPKDRLSLFLLYRS